MEYRQLGGSGVRVSEVALGGWLTQGMKLDYDATDRLVKSAFDMGIVFFDTADAYAKGESEKALALPFADMRRDDIFVATKCYWPMSENTNDKGLSRKHVFQSIEGSLSRMRLDYVDLYQYHRYDELVPMHELVRTMDDLIRQGKILYWGVSEWPVNRIVEAYYVARELGCCPPVSNQPQYSMMQRYIEPEILPTCVRYGMGQVVWSPLAQGVLTGKYKPGKEAPKGSRGADKKATGRFMQGNLNDETLQRVQKLVNLAKKYECSMAQFALAWCLRQPGVSSVIIGATNEKQLAENAGCSGLDIPEDAWVKADKILGIES